MSTDGSDMHRSTLYSVQYTGLTPSANVSPSLRNATLEVSTFYNCTVSIDGCVTGNEHCTRCIDTVDRSYSVTKNYVPAIA